MDVGVWGVCCVNVCVCGVCCVGVWTFVCGVVLICSSLFQSTAQNLSLSFIFPQKKTEKNVECQRPHGASMYSFTRNVLGFPVFFVIYAKLVRDIQDVSMRKV